MTDYQEVRLQASHGPDVRFEGRLVHEFTTQNKGGSKDRWTELRLWETPAGNWVAENVGMSTRGGEREIREVAVIEGAVTRPRGVPVNINGTDEMLVIDPDAAPSQEARLKVMDAFGWTTASKAFAREMGWDVVRRVE